MRHLHTFVAVAQQGTLGRAAESIKSEPASTLENANELEQLTGTRLFERGRLGAQLTLVGEQFLTHAVKVLDALNSAGQALNRKEGLNNDIVRIGALPTAALGILPTVIGQFHKQQRYHAAGRHYEQHHAARRLKIRGDRHRHWTYVRPGADERAALRTVVP
ncbi:LysR family transcriptional regulator [Klebsiella pneumoniae]